MVFRQQSIAALTGAVIAGLLSASAVVAQGHPGLTTLSIGSGSDPVAVAEADALIARMIQDGQLVVQASHDDTDLPGRQHEGLSQYVSGVPVRGASLSRQTQGGATVSIFGMVYMGIEINPTPTLSLGDATSLMGEVSGAAALQVTQPLIILPTLDGNYASLRMPVTASTSTLDLLQDGRSKLPHTISSAPLSCPCADGHVLMKIDEKHDQSAVGFGRGVLGDSKKVSATQTGGVFEARDPLRPGGILTLDTGSSNQRLERLFSAPPLDTDVARDGDNIWSNRGVVDTHVHMGWTFDYFFKRRGWSAIDDQNGIIVGVHSNASLARNNAFFVPPPFGPFGRGGVVFGATSSGTPITTLDVVAHELMHGVTEFGVRRRNSRGLESFLHLDGPGPTGVVIGGQFIPCSNTEWRFADGTASPFLCENGRFVVVSNSGGSAHEAFSDMFGTSVEFFFQDPGSGLLKADYLIGEDIPELGSLFYGQPGPTRSLRDPASSFVDTTRTVRYPSHYSRRLRFGVVVVGPGRLAPVPLAFDGDRTFALTNIDPEHWNSTILSHAFYLAIEGGRNPTSGVVVEGVGAANRDQIERVFFRAVTGLMPGTIPLPVTANVICQAAVDLFGHVSSEAIAVDQALHAVGLRPVPAVEWCRAL